MLESEYVKSLRKRLRAEGYSDAQINEVFERYAAGVEYAEQHNCQQWHVLKLCREKLGHAHNKL